MSPTEVTHRHFTGIVPPAGLLDLYDQRLFRNVGGNIGIVSAYSEASAGGNRFESFNCHLLLYRTVKVNRFAILDRNDGFLVLRGPPGNKSSFGIAVLGLASHPNREHDQNGPGYHLLHRLPELCLVCPGIYLNCKAAQILE